MYKCEYAGISISEAPKLNGCMHGNCGCCPYLTKEQKRMLNAVLNRMRIIKEQEDEDNEL